jgi:hypothetical protein
MTAALFIGFVVLMAAAIVATVIRYLDKRTAFALAASLLAWSTYVGLMGYCGVIRNTNLRPPGIAFIIIPIVIFLEVFIVATKSSAGARVALAFPLWIILAAQSFRIGVELFLHQLWIEGLVPKMLTFEGANVDIFVGLSAPLIAWFSTRGQPGIRVALVWNILGLLALSNVVVRAVLTAPGPLNLIHTGVPNLMMGTFPFVFIPGFFVPLAAVLHVVAIRAIGTQLRKISRSETK